MSNRRTQTDRVLAILRDAGGFYTSAQQITEQTGITRVAARIHDLKEQGIEIESKFVDRSKGKSYRLKASERIKQPPVEPDAFPEGLFANQSTAPKCAIDDDWEAA